MKYKIDLDNLKLERVEKIVENKDAFVITKDGLVKWGNNTRRSHFEGSITPTSEILGYLDSTDYSYIKTLCDSYICIEIPKSYTKVGLEDVFASLLPIGSSVDTLDFFNKIIVIPEKDGVRFSTENYLDVALYFKVDNKYYPITIVHSNYGAVFIAYGSCFEYDDKQSGKHEVTLCFSQSV